MFSSCARRTARSRDAGPWAAYRRKAAGIASALLVAVALAPAAVQAGAGLPRIAEVQAGSHAVSIYADSPTARVGANQLTVAVPNLPGDQAVQVLLTGPGGQVVNVPLRPLRVLGAGAGGRADAHGAATAQDGHDPAAAPAKDAHGDAMAQAGHSMATAQDGHGAASTPADHAAADTKDAHGDATADAHGDEEAGSLPLSGAYLARGTARLPVPGRWQATVAITGGQGSAATATAAVDVTDQRPNGIVLGAAGLLMAGSLLIGITSRTRRKP